MRESVPPAWVSSNEPSAFASREIPAVVPEMGVDESMVRRSLKMRSIRWSAWLTGLRA
ncbi:hypothetical protein FHR38_000324 [Micromonospora polyrhachis]|uniref:Uncharacterized protein n=1 Tax=Micromonospora polyrhachis TaxID=1282883 RepID=A0A7W7SLE7_9ACTN|nr:hypothetical protein [Micromonospora polyrhachis]